MLKKNSMAELIAQAGEGAIWQVVLRDEMAHGSSEEALREKMDEALQVMRASVADGMDEKLRSVSGMTGGQASKYRAHACNTPGREMLTEAAAAALAVAESNACMGRIVAAPTAGACGVVPGLLLALSKWHGYSDRALVDALFTAGGVGEVIARRASISGAEGGCQAEIGAAAAMAAAAAVQLAGGSAQMAGAAVAFALMNMLGLVCDPVGGLVEVPCVYRNVAGVAVALTASDMALAGLEGILPADEVIDAMGRVGKLMAASLRETGEEGCAACPSALKWMRKSLSGA
ncbi:MAG: L-serine ammonia-lyase, iron-sulfur-dependent, subunit alpha [Clostridia bacterium]